MSSKQLSYEDLQIDTKAESKRVEEWVKNIVFRKLRKKGVVIGLSGGIDSSVCAAICVESLGKDRVFGLFTPETECKEETNQLGRLIADHLGIEAVKEDITPILEGDPSGSYFAGQAPDNRVLTGPSQIRPRHKPRNSLFISRLRQDLRPEGHPPSWTNRPGRRESATA